MNDEQTTQLLESFSQLLKITSQGQDIVREINRILGPLVVLTHLNSKILEAIVNAKMPQNYKEELIPLLKEAIEALRKSIPKGAGP